MIDPADIPRIVRRVHNIADCLFAIACRGEQPDPDLDVVGAALYRGIHCLTDDESRRRAGDARLSTRFGNA